MSKGTPTIPHPATYVILTSSIIDPPHTLRPHRTFDYDPCNVSFLLYLLLPLDEEAAKSGLRTRAHGSPLPAARRDLLLLHLDSEGGLLCKGEGGPTRVCVACQPFADQSQI